MDNFISLLVEKKKIIIKGKECYIKSKVHYTIEEDMNCSYLKYELSDNNVLVIIPDDNLLYVGKVINDMKWKRISEDQIQYNGEIYNKTGGGHQIISKIEFGNKDEVEGKCIFEDYECSNQIISLGFLTDKKRRADVCAEIIKVDDIQI